MAGNPLNDPNFAANSAATVERLVGKVRRKAVQPVVYAARAAVFGLLGAFVGILALVLLLVALTRGLQALLDLAVSQPRAVYLSYLIIGALLCIVGLVLMAKRAPKSTGADR
ncbi:hypothetical protein BH20ACT4_BH20ACT4_01550 [soil metagenome]